MFLKENVLLAVAGLKSNKVRSFLTMLGIIIGIGSVIAIVSIGDAVTQSVTDTMAGLGASNIYVSVTNKDSGDRYEQQISGAGTMDDSDLLSMEQIEAFEQKFSKDISAVSLSESGSSGKARDGRRYANVSILGVNGGYGDVNDVKLTSGRFLRDRDIDGNRRVAVVSDKLVSNLFPGNADPLGKEINIEAPEGVETYTVVGVYKYERTSIGMMGGTAASDKDVRTDLYVPVSVVKETSANQNYSSFIIKTSGVGSTKTFTDRIKEYTQKLYENNAKYTCDVFNMENVLSSATSMLNTISIAIAAIAAIALLVGGIGVMNIMLVSVTERTREIGTRKALGARSGYIRMQFIVESVIICLIGGAIGIVVGILLAALGVHLMGMKLAVSVPVVFLSVGFSMLIGVFFGYYPAKKASALDPIEALRYE